jgi:hypothetical protein
MPKRTFWLVTGVAMGAGTSLWAERRLRRSVQQAAARLQPDTLVAEMGRSARRAAESAGERMRDALTSGRDEMQRREEELWADLAAGGTDRDTVVGRTTGSAPPRRTPGGARVRPVARTRTSAPASAKLPLHLGK